MRRTSAAGALFVVAAAAAGVAARAASPPGAYEAARRDAVHHVQVRIDRVEGLPWYTDHGPCVVSGPVVRVFRGDHAEGEPLSLAIDCAKPRARLPDGPALWTSWRAIEQAGYVEAYLDAEGAVTSWQTMLLSAPSDEPSCPVDLEGPC